MIGACLGFGMEFFAHAVCLLLIIVKVSIWQFFTNHMLTIPDLGVRITRPSFHKKKKFFPPTLAWFIEQDKIFGLKGLEALRVC